jgi:polar amino acid transport system permease protein
LVVKFDVSFAISLVPDILSAAVTTLWIAVVSSVLAVIIGFAFELTRRSGRPARLILTPIIDFLRVTPILAQLYFLYFVLPYYGIILPAIVVGILGLVVHYAGYLAEVFKAGIDAIPAGQREAGLSLGLHRWKVMLLIVAPQVARFVTPAVGNYFLSILKSTPYLAVLAIPEMLGIALDEASNSFRYVEPMTVVGVLFLLFCLTISRGVRWVESKVALRQR